MEKFAKIRGPVLQNKLLDFASQHPESSYISQFWFEMYLRDRRPVVMTHNPVMIFKQSSLGAAYNKVSVTLFSQLLRTAYSLQKNPFQT